MNFFRMRFVNTMLLFGVGITIGFMLKEKFYPAADLQNAPAYQSAYTSANPKGRSAGGLAAEAAAGGSPDAAPEQDELGPGETSQEEGDSSATAPEDSESVKAAAPAAAGSGDSAVQQGTSAPAGYSSSWLSSAAAGAPIIIEPERVPATPERGQEEAFFRNPASFQGRELQMDLQMITASKTVSGWRLNLVYAGPKKTLDYIYLDDTDGVLGAAPDLRIGYIYDVLFSCSSGLTDSDNKLISIKPTGQKADWATGMSAVE